VTFFVCVWNVSGEPMNGFVPNSQGRRVWFLAQTSLNVMVKVPNDISIGSAIVGELMIMIDHTTLFITILGKCRSCHPANSVGALNRLSVRMYVGLRLIGSAFPCCLLLIQAGCPHPVDRHPFNSLFPGQPG